MEGSRCRPSWGDSFFELANSLAHQVMAAMLEGMVGMVGRRPSPPRREFADMLASDTATCQPGWPGRNPALSVSYGFAVGLRKGLGCGHCRADCALQLRCR